MGKYFSLRSTDDIGEAIERGEGLKIICKVVGNPLYGAWTIITLEQLKDPNKHQFCDTWFPSRIPGAPKYQLYDFLFLPGQSGTPNKPKEASLKLSDYQPKKEVNKSNQPKLPI